MDVLGPVSILLCHAVHNILYRHYDLFSGVTREISQVEIYSQPEAIKKLLDALHNSTDPHWFDKFKNALAQERNAFMYFS